MKKFNTARKILDDQNKSDISVFKYIAQTQESLNAAHYYKNCEIVFYTLSRKDIDDLYSLLSNSKYESDEFLLFATISLCTADLSHLEQFISKAIIQKALKLDYLNTLKKITFDFRRKIKPTYLQGLSELYIASINRSLLQRDVFRQQFTDEIKITLNLKPIKTHESTLVLLLEEVQERTLSTVNKLIFDWIYILNKETPKLHIKVLVTNDFQAVQDGFPFGFSANKTIGLEQIYEEFGLVLENPETVELIYRPSHIGSLEWVLENLKIISPIAVMCFPNPQWPFLKVLKDYIPIIGVELANGVNLKDMCTVVFPNGKPNDHTKNKYGDMLFDIEFPQIAFKNQTNYTKTQFGLPENTPLIVSLGRQLFARSAIDLQQYFSKIKGFLDINQSCVFILVGEKPPQIINQAEFATLVDDKRILFIPDEQDIMSLLNICDIFAMPPIKGGGRGIGLAASIGLPCVSFDISDGAKSLPSHLIFKLTDLDGYFQKLDTLLNNKVEYETESFNCSQIFTDKLFSKISNATNSAIKLARANFNEQR